jgi:hypothetical protein
VPWTTKVQAYDITNEADRKRCEEELKLTDPLLGIATNKCIKVVPDEPCPPSWVNGTRSDPLQKNFYKAFVYSVPSATKPPNSLGIWTKHLNGRVGPQEDDASYRVFLALSDGSTTNNNQVQFLKDQLWLDKFTREVNIKFALYNGMLGMFTFVNIKFGFSLTGAYRDFDTKGGTKVQIKSINMEPYRLRQRTNCTLGWTLDNNGSCYEKNGVNAPRLCRKCSRGKVMDEIQLACEVVMMIWIFYEIAGLMIRIVSCSLVGWADKEAEERAGIMKQGLRSLVTDLWFYVDILNYILFLLWIAIRTSLVILLVSNSIKVPTNQYEMVLEYAYKITNKQLMFNFANVVLCLLRMFKFYRFQPRLAIVNQTLSVAGPDLFHFFLMFMTFLYGFGVITNILFGPQMHMFSTLPDAISSAFFLMLGAGMNMAAMANVDGEMAVLWNLSFMFLVSIILLNVLLAILVDSYMTAKEKELELWQEKGYEELPSMLDQIFSWQIIRYMTSFGAVPDLILLAALERVKERLEAEHGCTLRELSEPHSLITIADIFEAIPQLVREQKEITMKSISRAGAIQWSNHDTEEEEEEMVKIAGLGESVATLHPVEQALCQRLQELTDENIRLQRQHRLALAQAVAKHGGL